MQSLFEWPGISPVKCQFISVQSFLLARAATFEELSDYIDLFVNYSFQTCSGAIKTSCERLISMGYQADMTDDLPRILG